MTIQEMHYAFKIALNKIDSQQYRNLTIPEIDFLLNQAVDLFIKMNVRPRYNIIPGFEKTQRDTDEIRSVVIADQRLETIEDVRTENYTYFRLPDDYQYYISAEVIMNNGVCGDKKGRLIVRQHDDRFEDSPFDRSSFDWGEINAVFDSIGIRCYKESNVTLNTLLLTYIPLLPYIHFAEGMPNNTYTNLRNETLTGVQHCTLPDTSHSEIIDIAVLLATQDLQIPDYNIKLNKLKLT